MTTPAPDTGRTAEENELRAGIIGALNAAFRGFSFPGGRWSTGYGAEMAAEALLSGPLAPILQEAANLRDQLRESAMQHIARDLGDEQAWTEIATLRARLQEAERALKPFAAAVFNDNGDVTISTGHLMTRDWLAAKRARAALAAKAAPLPESDTGGKGA